MLIQEFLTFWIRINQMLLQVGTQNFLIYLCNRIKNLYDENEINKLSLLGVMSLIERFIKWVENIKSMIFKVYHI